MAEFPTTEAEIVMLALKLQSGLQDNPTLYPDPPVSQDDLAVTLVTFVIAKDQATPAQAAALQAVAAKDAALNVLVDDMKAVLRYAENAVHFDDDKLKLLGWGGRAAPTALAPPGQVRSLEAPRQGEGWIFLDWKAPGDGGAVAAYRIQRRLRPNGSWSDAGLAIESETTLTGQERAREWEYRVSAVNKAGEGEASNTVMAVL